MFKQVLFDDFESTTKAQIIGISIKIIKKLDYSCNKLILENKKNTTNYTRFLGIDPFLTYQDEQIFSLKMFIICFFFDNQEAEHWCLNFKP